MVERSYNTEDPEGNPISLSYLWGFPGAGLWEFISCSQTLNYFDKIHKFQPENYVALGSSFY